jgi:hypothetical protein
VDAGVQGRELGSQIRQTTGLWSKGAIEARTAVLVDFVLGRWPLWIEG